MKILSSFVLVVFVLLFCLPQFSSAEIGVKLGPQRSNFNSGGFDMSRFKFGVFYSKKINENITLQPEIYFSQMGINYFDVYYPNGHPSNPGKYIWQYTDKLSYIEIPLLVKYSIKLKGDLMPIFFGGGYAAIRVSKNLAISDDVDWTSSYEEYFSWPYLSELGKDASPRPWTSEDTYQPHAPVDAGLVFGIGLEHGRDKVKMTFDMRVNIGMTNMYKESTLQLKRRNNSMSFLLGLSF